MNTLIALLFTTIITIIPSHLLANQKKDCENDDNSIQIWPTVTADPKYIDGQLMFRLVQINWEANETFPDDTVAVFEELPEVGSMVEVSTIRLNDSDDIINMTDPNRYDLISLETNDVQIASESDDEFAFVLKFPIFVARPESTQGSIKTPITHRRPTASQLAKGGCVGVSVAYVREGIVKASRCIASHPQWIWKRRSSFSDIPLRSMILPGTHNSGTYSVSDTVDPVNSWIVCQDEAILSQLLLGVRYLDLRVSYYPESKELLWISHDKIRWTPLQIVLNDIRTFSYLSPDPVIIDIHRTPVGFDNEVAKWLLVSLINSTLGNFLAPSSFGNDITPRDMWAIGRTVIVSYGSSWMRYEVPWLWPPIFQAWANAQLLEDLRQYLDEQMEGQSQTKKLWAAMGHLTPSIWDYIFKAGTGIREWADRTAEPLSTWLRKRWAKKANILTSDFILNNDIIFLSIRLNFPEESCQQEALEMSYPTYHSPSSNLYNMSRGHRLLFN